MKTDNINSLFTLFSGESDISKYEPLINSAVSQVSSQLREGADSSDSRLDFLCASIANFRYAQIECVRNKVAFTYAGTADREGNSQLEYMFAKELMLGFYRQCSDLLCDNGFCFCAVGGEED